MNRNAIKRRATSQPLRTAAFTVLSVSVLLLLISGCAGPEREFEDLPPSPELLSSHIEKNWNTFQRYESRISLSVRSGDFAGTLFGDLKLEPPDRMYLKLNAPFGIPIGELTVRDGYYEAVFGTGRFETGSVEEFDLEQMTGIPLPAGDVLRVFEPLVRPVNSGTETIGFAVTGDDSLWQWRVAEYGADHQIQFDPSESTVDEERWLDLNTGSVILVKEYRDHRRMNDVPLAEELYLQSGGAYPATVTIRTDDAELNPEWKSDPFQLRSKGGS